MRLRPVLSVAALAVLTSVVLLLPESSPATPASAALLTQTSPADSPCLVCHQGIAEIRDATSGMMAQIGELGTEVGDPAGCTVCHGGNLREEEDADLAHRGAPGRLVVDRFYPDPGSVWIAENTCGQCHPDTAFALERSLMNTEAGKIQGNMFTWTVLKDNQVIWGN